MGYIVYTIAPIYLMVMEKLTKEKEERILLYATYSVLYINDLACNLIKELHPVMESQDKETRKIYGALLKRANKYFHMMEDIVGCKIECLADYFSEMDDIADPIVEEFRNEIALAYQKANIENYDFFAKVETMRSMCDFAKFSALSIIEKVSSIVPKSKFLYFYKLDDISRVANNLANWVYRKVPKGIDVTFEKESETIKSLEKLNEALLEFDNFHKSYQKAIEYDYIRNNKNV